jgi:23S rRNA pseudouridine2457 synthase
LAKEKSQGQPSNNTMANNYYLFNKPYGVLSQFTREVESHKVIGDYYNFPKDVYPVGRLDKDSEGLLILTNDKNFVDKTLNPRSQKSKVYLAQVEGEINFESIEKLQEGVFIKLPTKKMYKTLSCIVTKFDGSNINPRNPPIRIRKHIPTSWIKITLQEGKNRQVRKMCSSVGFPVLRLIRISIGKYELNDLESGEVKRL